MSGFLPGLAQLAAAGLVKAGLAKRPEKQLSKRRQPQRPRDTTSVPTPTEKIEAPSDVPQKQSRPGSQIDLTA